MSVVSWFSSSLDGSPVSDNTDNTSLSSNLRKLLKVSIEKIKMFIVNILDP